MSTQSERFKWYGYIRWMIRLYPARVQELRRLQHAAKVTAYDRDGAFHGDSISRPTEILGTVTLGATCDREVEAVRKAILATRAKRNGDLILRLIDLQFWSCTHNLTGAAMELYISKSTAQKWNGAFIREVGNNFGLMDYTTEARKLKPVKCSLASL